MIAVTLRFLDNTTSPALVRAVPREGEHIFCRKNHEKGRFIGRFIVLQVQHHIDLPHDPEIVLNLGNP